MPDLLGTKPEPNDLEPSLERPVEQKLKKDGFVGDILTPADDGYESARQIWNAMIDKRPAVIARCATTSDVVRAVEIARDAGMVLAVRGGGHHIAGNALCEGGMVIDLSRMRSARVDARTQRATIEGGATLADLDAATQAHGLATPVGINSTTGIGGLTLGGGFGWLSRKYGMTIDNLESAELVTAAGEVKRVSQDAHGDLFWALRGGGGNFGVVTRFEFRLHPVGPNLLCGLVVYPTSAARSVLQQYGEIMAEAPDELTAWAVLRAAPPLPFLPQSVHGEKVLVLAFLYAGDPQRGAALVEPLRRLDTPVGEHVGIQPYVAWQQLFDPLLTAGARNYWKSHNFAGLDDGLFDAALAALDRLPSPQCEIFFAALGGATTRPATASTAYPHRDARFVMNVHGRWDQAADDQRCVSWARQLFDAAAPFATGGVYVNFMTADEGERVRAAYGANHRRLAAIKAEHDPSNLFRINQNIRPG